MSANLVSHIGICVDDLDLALRFYSGAFGFRETSRSIVGDTIAPILGLQSSDLEVCLIALADRPAMRIELIYFRNPAAEPKRELPMNNIGFTHLAIYVDDIETTCRKVTEYGGAVLEGRKAVLPADGSLRFYQMVTDPFGTRVELIRAPVRG